MKIERGENGSIHYEIETEEHGTISGGIMAIEIEHSDDEHTARQDYFDYCAGLVQPGCHDIDECIKWLEQNWDVQPLPKDDRELAMHRFNIAMNPPYVKEPYIISADMADDEIQSSILAQHAAEQRARRATDEELGIETCGYRILDTSRNRVLFDEDIAENARVQQEQGPQDAMPDDEPPCDYNAFIFFERKACSVAGSGVGCNALLNRLVIYKGVSRQDIETRSNRFMSYVLAAAAMGKLPSFEQYQSTIKQK